MSMLVDNPILNSPFEDPTRHWAYEEGQAVLKEGRRPAGYYLKARTRGPQAALLEEEFVPLELVNTIRDWVKAWRERGYPGVPPSPGSSSTIGTTPSTNASSSSASGKQPKPSSGSWRPPRRRSRGL
jgi:hypothetical protein